MYYAYILQSLKDKRTYTGFCENVDKRLLTHNSRKVNATKNRVPFKILLVERFETIKEAKSREQYWKSGPGRRKLKQLFKHGFPPTSP